MPRVKDKNLKIAIITLFPEVFKPYIESSIIKRACLKGQLNVSFYNPRDFSGNIRLQVDDRPYGGGPGMTLQAGPILHAALKAKGRDKSVKILITSPRGQQFDSKLASEIGSGGGIKKLIVICGRYEGIDARIKKILRAEEVSIGPYILTGGELPALVILDAIARHIPGVLGKHESLEEKRTASREVYTRPETILYKGKKYRVPKVLVSGNHKKIEEWRKRHQ